VDVLAFGLLNFLQKFRDGEVVFYHEKGEGIHALILFPYGLTIDYQ